MSDQLLPHPVTGKPFPSPVPPGTGWPGDPATAHTPVARNTAEVVRLAARADSALGVGDLELFGRLWRALMSELAPVQRPR